MVAFPVLLMMVLAIVQFAVWSHATHVAQAAATQGLDATRVVGGTQHTGETETWSVLNQLDTGPLTGANIAVTRTAQAASVQVRGHAESVVPFVDLPVHAEAHGVVEKFGTNP